MKVRTALAIVAAAIATFAAIEAPGAPLRTDTPTMTLRTLAFRHLPRPYGLKVDPLVLGQRPLNALLPLEAALPDGWIILANLVLRVFADGRGREHNDQQAEDHARNVNLLLGHAAIVSLSPTRVIRRGGVSLLQASHRHGGARRHHVSHDTR